MLLLPVLATAAPKEKADSVGHEKLSLPFIQMDKAHSTGSARSYGSEIFEKYPTIDLRNSMTGLINGLEVREIYGTTGIRFNSDNSDIALSGRGLAPIYIVDNVPVYFSELQLDPEQIESITYAKDIIDKAMFGPRASGGIIYIKTKRGTETGRKITVNIQRGVEQVDRMPEWVNGADYARLNNIARDADNLPILYSEYDISQYALGNANDLVYPNVDFRQLMLKDTRPMTKANVNISGGGKGVKYNAYMGYASQGDIYKVGETSDFNRANVATNLDIAINRQLDVNVNFMGGITWRRSPRYGNGDVVADEFTKVIGDLKAIPSISFPLLLQSADTSAYNIYGVSKLYGNNPYADLTESGFYTEKGRSGVTQATINYDFSELVPNLKSETFVGLNVFNLTRIGKTPDYNALIYNPSDGSTTITGHTGAQSSDKTLMTKQTYQNLQFNEKLSHSWSKNGHLLNSALIYYLNSVARSSSTSYERQQNVIANISYSYKDKYLVQAVGNYAGSSMFKKGRRYGFFPSVGLGWVVSNENFMKNSSWLSYLKVRAQAGKLGYESFSTPYWYEDYYQKGTGITFGPYSVGQWFGSTTAASNTNTLSRLGNANLFWEMRKEFNVGIDASMLDNRLGVELTFYNQLRDDIITERTGTMPNIYGMSNTSVYENYNSYLYRGVEAAIRFSDRIGNFRYSLGASATYSRIKFMVYDQVYTYDYQRVEGTYSGSYRGYVCLGKFTSQEEIDSWPQQLFSDVQVGDLKYKDLNGDNIIDTNDQQIIGNTSPKLFYSINIQLGYKNFDLTIVGTGRAMYDDALTNSYYWNGWGNGNYSAFVRDNIGGDYPRLAYNQISNNFVASSFWLRKGGYFKIQNVELGYNIPLRSGNKAGLSSIRIFASGANLLTISKMKDLDPESLGSGLSSYPLFKTYSGGLRLTF